MRLRTEIAVTLGALLALQVVTVLASVSLMTRVGPTISIKVVDYTVMSPCGTEIQVDSSKRISVVDKNAAAAAVVGVFRSVAVEDAVEK
jgi:uncharacterized membrane protein (DUF441 family)